MHWFLYERLINPSEMGSDVLGIEAGILSGSLYKGAYLVVTSLYKSMYHAYWVQYDLFD